MFVDMMGGRQPYLVAAMKSLPLREDDEPANSSLAEREMVSYLIAECSRQLEGEPFHHILCCSNMCILHHFCSLTKFLS